MLRRLKSLLPCFPHQVSRCVGKHLDDAERQLQLRTALRDLKEQTRTRTPDNPALSGFKVYSQLDEDGIINEILRRIPRAALTRTAVEIGCGNGFENNTHFLVLQGYRAYWVDASQENIDLLKRGAGLDDNSAAPVRCEKVFIDLDNIAEVVRCACGFLRTDEPDLFCLDIDGNDLYVLEKALEHSKPKVICVEYNAKFPPPARVAIRYNQHHVWSNDDYYGASLQSFCDLLKGYVLVSCNLAGANAFFVRSDLGEYFARYTAEQLYQPLRVELAMLKTGHSPSLKFLRDTCSNLSSPVLNLG